MRKVEIEVYTINELPEKAKKKAYDKWLGTDEYYYSSENEKTLEKFADIFPIHITNWEYDSFTHNIRFDFTDCDEIEELRGFRLAKYIWNNYWYLIFKGKYYSTQGIYDENKNYHHKCRYSKIQLTTSCVLTGYYMDEIILEPVYEFLNKPYDINFSELMKKCLDNWGKACVDDFNHCTSMEHFVELCEINGYEYTIDGSQHY